VLNLSKSFLELPLERFALLKAYFFLSNFLFLAVRLGNVSLLEEYMLKILEINPSDVVVHYNLGFLFKEKNNLTRQRNTI
jgi:hypothetical protein